MRLSDIAEILAEVDRTDVAPLHIRLRNPLFKGLLSGTAGQTRNSPADYNFDELVRARLLSALFDCRLSTADLALVNAALSCEQINSLLYLNGLQAIIQGTLVGENWKIRIGFVRTKENTTTLKTLVYLENNCAPDKSDEEFGFLVLPASDLISPVLRYYNNAN